ncbi:hypothetical protein M2G93_19290 [Vibrio vulnificus]|uniref:hypothetical protein n=1 Tax=Vibrio vulnificus TaxID=672 RepID=UPI0021D7F356|nr:hypothetical protein [Vibrio vulnificus]EHD1697927.1 hypothetical protein [Vibrio vulnificus]EKZ9225729.1 hypothetical protein [Vibrio vulnificus]ELC9582572.1 hypothetical protein [Vibrio vulnificus]MCU8150269.1 hypothetical protein [Vibrio vulnificus]
MYTVRCFGNDAICSTIEELAITLATDYAGTSVAIHYVMPSGRKAMVFVDVLLDGTIINSYGRGDIFVLTSLSA